MGSNPKGRGAEETRERLPAQRARREAPQRPPAEQAEPLTAHPKIVEAVNFGWPSFLSPFQWVRTRMYLYIRTLGEQNPPFTDGKQIADAFGVKWRTRDDRCLNTYKPAGHRQYQKPMLQI